MTRDDDEDWRYCKCSHKADDHNPLSLWCYKCDCQQWVADIERSKAELQSRMPRKVNSS